VSRDGNDVVIEGPLVRGRKTLGERDAIQINARDNEVVIYIALDPTRLKGC